VWRARPIIAAVVSLTALTRHRQDSLSDLRRPLRIAFGWVAEVILAG
jgi:hypothetical protein